MPFILRFDDVAPTMAWAKFLPMKATLENHRIPCLLGVVPECQDETLCVEPPRPDFFDRVRRWKDLGDTIAQHGTFHAYQTKDAGILNISRGSEFAGLSLEDQLSRCKIGKTILEREEVWQPYFMPPNHSFDHHTLDALKQLGFEAITDGYGFWPYQMRGITLVPQLTATPVKVAFGVWTICVHVNTASTQEISRLVRFSAQNKAAFISFEEAVTYRRPPALVSAPLRSFSALALKTMRRIRGARTPSG